MPDLEPITRDEKLWSGEDLEPITRREMYIKHLYDETQVIPDKPITREEMFILKAGEELHDVTIEQLTATENRTYSEEGVAYSPVIVNVPQTTLTTLDVTENGTYTAPSGTAYNEVEVDVPLPDNAYLLKDIANTPASIATFTDGSALPMPKLEIAVEPQQDLHGYDYPWVGGAGKNKFPIATATSSGTQNIFTAQTVSLKANTNYVLSFDSATPTTKDMSMSFNNGNTQVRGITISAGVTSFNLTFNQNVDNINWYVREAVNLSNIMIEEGSTKTTFAPYSNECPISGWSAVDVTVADDVDNPTTTKTITIQLGDTYYGGKLDVVSGVLTVTHGIKVYSGNSSEGWYADGTQSGSTYRMKASDVPSNIKLPPSNADAMSAISNQFIATSADNIFLGNEGIGVPINGGYLTIYDSVYNTNDVSLWKTHLASNPMQLVYELATPTTIQLTPTQVNSLMGVNNIWADCGDIIDGQYFGKEV